MYNAVFSYTITEKVFLIIKSFLMGNILKVVANGQSFGVRKINPPCRQGLQNTPTAVQMRNTSPSEATCLSCVATRNPDDVLVVDGFRYQSRYL